jgi:hypothetical protein
MPFKMSNWLEGKLADYLMRGVSYSFPSNVYLGLLTTFDENADGDDYIEVDPNDTAYTRRQATFAAPSGGSTSNSSTITFPMATLAWGSIPYFGIFDSLTDGNLMYWAQPTQVLTCSTGEQLEFLSSQLTLAITGDCTTQLKNDIVNMTVRNIPRAMPAGWYTALLTSFTSDSVYNECADGSYVRQATVFTAPSDGVVANSGQLLWSPAVGSFTIPHVAVFDQVTGGIMLARGPLPVPKSVTAAQQFKFAAGDLEVAFD